MVAVVFLVAGMSSRFGGNPKQMAKIGPNEETLIEYSVNQALKQKFSELIFITNPNTEHLFKNIFKEKYQDRKVKYIQQKYDTNKRTRPWGTTDAICCLLGHTEDSFILVNGDDIYGEPTFEKGFEKMRENKNIIGGLKLHKTIHNNGSVNRGIISISNDKVIQIEEMLNISITSHPELMDELANVNFIGLQNDVLNHLQEILTNFKRKYENHNNIECFLTDNLSTLLDKNIISMEFFEITENIIGLTNPEDENIVKKLLAI